eukprot:6020681-Prorocentrum_lima.AAC.1
MTGSAAIAALTTGRHAQSVAIVQRAGLRRRAAALPHAPPCATHMPSDLRPGAKALAQPPAPQPPLRG